jgi:hypothetical protein
MEIHQTEGKFQDIRDEPSMYQGGRFRKKFWIFFAPNHPIDPNGFREGLIAKV